MKSFVSIVLSAVVTAVFFEGVLVLWCFVNISQNEKVSKPQVVEVEPPPEIDPLPPVTPEPKPERQSETSPPEREEPEVVNESTKFVGPPQPEARLPFVMNISRFDNGLMLQGSIPSKEVKDAIFQAAASAVEGGEVFNRLKYSPKTENPEWLPHLPEMVLTFFAHTGGEHELTIVDERLILGGSVPEEGAKAGILAMAGEFSSGALKIESELPIDSKLMGKLPEFSRQKPEVVLAEAEASVPGVLDETPENEESSEGERETVEDRSFYGPAVGPPEEENAVVYVSTSKGESKTPTTSMETEEATETSKPKKPIRDDGKPLIFYFETGSAEILPDDREKVQRAIQRASTPRSIVYITAYADHRGSYQLNKKLSLARAERVRDAIFSGQIADEVTAEITAKSDSQSEKRNVGGKVSDEALRRSRRVVVEVYHLKS
ncbi:MAG: hypothetical protein CMO55_19410 [Verrucomicrobiales bacterium]|nr:hypothetical protein [Verrucomicrobiales bacterium]